MMACNDVTDSAQKKCMGLKRGGEVQPAPQRPSHPGDVRTAVLPVLSCQYVYRPLPAGSTDSGRPGILHHQAPHATQVQQEGRGDLTRGRSRARGKGEQVQAHAM